MHSSPDRGLVRTREARADLHEHVASTSAHDLESANAAEQHEAHHYNNEAEDHSFATSRLASGEFIHIDLWFSPTGLRSAGHARVRLHEHSSGLLAEKGAAD